LRTNPAKEAIELVGGILENYANRGVFRGFTRGPVRAGKATYQMVWHHDRRLEMIFDPGKNAGKGTMRFPRLLPGIPPGSEMHGEFKAFLEARHAEDLPEHRRIDPRKARARSINKGGNVSLTLSIEDGDYGYATRRIIHLVDEIFKAFLGDYYEYQVENLGLDPDRY